MKKPNEGPKPFYRKSTNCWYLQIDKKQIRLADSYAESVKIWHQIMASNHDLPSKKSSVVTVQSCYEMFVSDLKANKNPRTVQWYVMYLDKFILAVKGDTPIDSCRVLDATTAINMHTEWKPNGRHNYCRAIKRLFLWAYAQGITASNIMINLKGYSSESRDDYITPQQMVEIENQVDGAFKDLLIVAWDTGMRPQELFQIEARHYDPQECKITIPSSEAKGRIMRVVYIGTERCCQLLNILAKKHKDGPILRNHAGNPWNRNSARQAFSRHNKKTGLNTHLGAFRKGYCTEALKSGLDTVTVSHLMGHVNAVMVSKVYAKVQHDTEFMHSASRRAKRS
ncbi:MAG: site-specific integrase [Planctomycetota bacterium]